MLVLSSIDIAGLEKAIIALDTDKSGKIDYTEFIHLTIEKKKYLQKENLELTFKIMDVDGNGKLTIEELRKAFEAGSNARTDKFWKKFIKEIDKDGDSQISLEEFC